MDLTLKNVGGVGGVPCLEERLREEAQQQLLASMRGESARPGKRRLRPLSAAEKLDAIQRVHEGECKTAVARDIGVPESTFRGWCKSEHKIREMVQNSSTPDSEVRPPAASSGVSRLAGTSNMSSEVEGLGPSGSKKAKLDYSGGCDTNVLNDSTGLDSKQTKVDYMSSTINSLMAGGVRSESSSILLQQLGHLQSAQSAANLTKNILNLSNGGLPSLLPATPRKTSEHYNQAFSFEHSLHSSRSSEKGNGSIGNSARKIEDVQRKTDNPLFGWLAQQHQILGHSTVPYNASTSGIEESWYWQWYKNYIYTNIASQTIVEAQQPLPSQLFREIPSDSISATSNDFITTDERDSETAARARKKGIEHGEEFLKCLSNGGVPSISLLQLMQLRRTLDSIKYKNQ